MEVIEVDPLIALSIKLGVDLTPNQDLEERLDAIIAVSRHCVEELEELHKRVKDYSLTVKGFETPKGVTGPHNG